MFGLFKTKSEKLNSKYRKLLNEAYVLSTSNRKLSDLKYVEANDILKEIENLKKQ